MPDERQLTILCLASYYKGDDFLCACKDLGCKVLLLTQDRLKDSPWRRDCIDEFFTLSQPERQASGDQYRCLVGTHP